jgi:hypothetical protein
MDAGGISAIITSILFVLIGVAYGHKLYTEGAFTSGAPTDLSFLSLLVLYFPNTLFAYGFIADIMNGRYHYSVASIAALGGMFTNKVVGGYLVDAIMYVLSFIGTQFAKLSSGVQALVATAAAVGTAVVAGPAVVAAAPGIEMTAMATPAAVAAAAPVIAAPAAAAAVGTAAASSLPLPPLVQPFPEGTVMPGPPPPMQGGATDLCSLPGFEWLENKIAPQGIVMSMTVLWYLMIELWDTGAGPQSMALGITSAITFGLQWFVLHRSNCLTSYKYGTYSAIIAVIMGITFAGTSYGIQKQIAKYRGTSSVPPVPSGKPGTFVCPPGTVQSLSGDACVNKLGPGGTAPSGFGASESIINVGGSNEKTQAVDDNDQFVCEAYKDGELVTSTIVE